MNTRKQRRMLLRGLYAVYLTLLVSFAYRGFLWWVYSVPPTDLSNQVDACQLHYGELFARGIVDSRRSDSQLNILLPGASVAEQTGAMLQTKLSKATGRIVRVHNAAVSAHTTQDSLNKLKCLMERGAEFDRIIIYHAINDVRMNCVAAKDFRDDYTHCGWYAAFNRKKQTGAMSVQETVSDSWTRLIGLGEPEEDYLAFGDEIKTGPAFRSHMQEMINLAETATTPVTLMTFATCFIDGYTKDAFTARTLGYAEGQYALATEVWGKPDNVKKGVAAHNDVIRQLSIEHKELVFIEMAEQLTGLEYFSDVCHLSPAGLERFTDIVAQQLLDGLQSDFQRAVQRRNVEGLEKQDH